MPEGFVKISSYWTQSEAHLAKLRLESYGIDAELENEMMVGTLWNHANAVGGVKLLVKHTEADQAASILNLEFDNDSLEDSLPTEVATASGEHSSDWQSVGVNEEDLDDGGRTPQVFSRMRSIMKTIIEIQLYVWAIMLLASLIHFFCWFQAD